VNKEPFKHFIEIGTNWLITYGPNILTALIILIAGRFLAQWIATLGKKAILRTRVDITLAGFISNIIYYALLTTVILAAADQLGVETTSFLAILATAGLAIGLALKASLANFASGILLILFQPFRVGDAVTTAGITGKVERIDIFSTVILAPDNKKIIIPNSSITNGVITNITAMPTRRIDLMIGISYNNDIIAAKQLLENIIQTEDRILTEPAPCVAVTELAHSSVILEVFPWVKTDDYGAVRCSLLEKIKIKFNEQGISFP
jgi:small conductance mechanosensitive channel